MKLLDKMQVNLAKAFERKVEIDEGKKLATSVDRLRELRISEEASLEKWRESTMAIAKLDIQAKENEKKELQQDIDKLKADRNYLLIPVNLREKELDARKEALDAKEKALIREKNAVTAADENVKEALAGAVEALRRAEDRDEDSKITHEATLVARKSSAGLMRESQKALDKAKETASQILQDVNTREAAIAVREREFLMKQDGFAREQEALNLRERAIIDREETLDREEKRRAK